MGDLTPPGRSTLGIICGLRSEVQRAERALGPDRDRAITVASGASSERATEQAENLARMGVAALVSFGIGGALEPGLQVGDVVRATRVAWSGGAYGAKDGPLIWGSGRIVTAPADRAAIFDRTGAVLVDMESHAVARAACRAGLPVLVIRAVSDVGATALPAYLENAVHPDGRPDLGAVLGGVLHQPLSLPALIRLGRNTARALDAAERAAKVELPALLRRLDAA